jgi:hypothetical protein
MRKMLAVFGALVMVTKICVWDGGVCSGVSCSSLDLLGDVQVCSRHRNRSGFHVSRIRGFSVVPVFSKHRSR